MAEIKNLKKDELNLIIAEKGFSPTILTKDYYLTIILYLIKDIKGIYFKGGTALQKTILNYSRLSEDIDFTLDKDLEEVKKKIKENIMSSNLFGKISKDKDVSSFTRLIVPYDSELGKGQIFIDLNKRGSLLTRPEHMKISHPYSNIPNFSMPCLSKKEMIAEKMSATITRNKPRDHFDLYKIIENNHDIDLELVKKKCKQSGTELNIIRMFDKAKKLNRRWDDDMIALLSEDIGFKKVMTTLARYFKLKEEKEKLKK